MNKQQLTDLVIIPTLKEIPSGYSPEAVMAIQMIIAHESVGGIIPDDDGGFTFFSEASRLVYDLRYNVFMARQKLFMADGALPGSPEGMAAYLKKHWNGDGKATADKYYDDFMGWV